MATTTIAVSPPTTSSASTINRNVCQNSPALSAWALLVATAAAVLVASMTIAAASWGLIARAMGVTGAAEYTAGAQPASVRHTRASTGRRTMSAVAPVRAPPGARAGQRPALFV